jgi:hypothetical protein
MSAIIQDMRLEIADNWPAFVYIALTIVFSICFFRERRAEARIVHRMGERIQENIRTRFDHLESLVRDGALLENSQSQPEREAKTAGRFSS